MANKYRLDSKRFKNPICQACIERNIEKYGRFEVNCEGITVEDDIKFAMKYGKLSEEEARYLYDPVYFFGQTFGSDARDYQEGVLRCTSRSLVARQCRQTGKTLALVNKILHFTTTNENKTALIITPQEKQVKKIWDEYIFRDAIYKSEKLKSAVTSKREKPYYQVTFDNGSKIILMIAGPGARGQTADWIYIDEAALIPTETLNDILMTIASRGDDATILLSSTPMGRGNIFYKACKEDPLYSEFHVSIYDVPIMANQIDRFKEILGETGFIQECLAEFPDVSGGPFNFKGISKAIFDYTYDETKKTDGCVYIGGVDWNGPGIGTYLYVIEFNLTTYRIRVVDKKVVSSAEWNSTVAKNALIELNRKWIPDHWMCDYGYGTSIVEELKLFSMHADQPPSHPDSLLKHTIETVNFGLFTEIEDPFTKEIIRKTTKSFIVSQVSKLFEMRPGQEDVPIKFSKNDEELKKSLESYKLLNITSRNVEQYGFDKKDKIEDHAIDAFMLACYGITKYYGELFKKIVFSSALFERFKFETEESKEIEESIAGGIVLLTDNHPEPITLDESKIYDPTENKQEIIIARSFSKGMSKRKYSNNFTSVIRSRGGFVKRSKF